MRVIARYRAPATDGGLLTDPPLDRVGDLLAANTAHLNSSTVRIAGVPLPEFRRAAVAEVIEVSRRYLAESGEPAPPTGAGLIMAGHQPEFFHPGVWVKNFVLHRLAARHGLAPINLVVDNDTVKSTAVRVPIPADDPEDVQAASVPIDGDADDRTYEEYRVRDRELFDSFPDRLASLPTWGRTSGLSDLAPGRTGTDRPEVRPHGGGAPLAFTIWPALRAEVERVPFGEAVSRVRRGQERMWGTTNFELPVSRLAGTRAFAGFVHTVLADLPRLRDCYNAAIRAYRKANGLRSQNHPAPELGARDKVTLEAPFWVWRTGGRRERLFVRYSETAGRTLLAGETPIGQFHLGAEKFADWLGRQGPDGWKVRPRALTLTLFARLCLADGFIHGIGGGKYDEVTDEIIRRAFAIEPSGYAVVSATLRLPLRRFAATEATLRTAERRVRDLDWNPQRFAELRPRFPALAAEKEREIAAEPTGKAARREWFRHLQQVTREMRPAVAGELAAAERDLARTRAELAANAILGSREYAWPLFPEGLLRTTLARG